MCAAGRPADPGALLASARGRDPAGPLLTFYDDRTGERTELSATTTVNWVAKTANLLRDDLGVVAGDAVTVLLPAHWQTAVVLLALWSIGGVPTSVPGDGLVVADDPHLAAALRSGACEVLGLSLRPMNARLADPPAGVMDYAAEVLAAGDVLTGAQPSGQDDARQGYARAAQLGLVAGDRLLVSDAAGPADAADWLLAPLAAGASVVLCRNADPAKLPARAEQERVTATLGQPVEGVRPLTG